MSLAAVLGVAIGAAVGAPMRFAVERWFVARRGAGVPYGTFIVNLVGSLILGLLTGFVAAVASRGHVVPAFVVAAIGIGGCGALTTFSGFSAQVLELSRASPNWHGPFYAGLSMVAGVALAAAGYAIGLAV